MRRTSALVLSSFVASTALGWADKPGPFQYNIDMGRKFLAVELPKEGRLGYLSLGLLAMIKTAPSDSKGKAVKDALIIELTKKMEEKIVKDASEFNSQEGTYTLAVTIMALIADDPGKHEPVIRRLVKMLVDRQMENGGWPYPNGGPANGDTSQTQYVILALWDASTIGIEVPPKVWDSAFYWHICTQDAKPAANGGAGGFAYHPSKVYEPGAAEDVGQETCTMGVAGYCSMLICQSQLPRLKAKAAKFMIIDELVRPAVEEGQDAVFVPKTTPELAMAAVQRAESWVLRFSPFRDPYKNLVNVNYYLYGLERVAALRKGGDFKKNDWYGSGGSHLAKTQQKDGSWNPGSHWGTLADTSFALLFLGKTMEKKLEKLQVDILPRSVAISGEGGLPTADGAQGGAFQRQYDRYRSKPASSIDEIVRILEDPGQVVEEETAVQMEQLTPDQLRELVQKVGADARKLRQWAYDKRPGARHAALTALARTRDPRVAPILIDHLTETDALIYTAAYDGLRYLSRNVDVFGLPTADKRKPETIKAGAERAKAWSDSMKVQFPAYQVYTPPNP